MNSLPFGPQSGSSAEYDRIGAQVRADPDAAWVRLLQIVEQVDDAGLFWVGDILGDFLNHHPTRFADLIEPELSRNTQLRRAFVNVVPTTTDETLAARVLALRDRCEREFL